MSALELVDPSLMMAFFPEVPATGLKVTSNMVGLLIGPDNLRLF